MSPWRLPMLISSSRQVDGVVAALEAEGFIAKRFDWTINLTGQSDVSVPISSEEFNSQLPSRSEPVDVHGILMRVASLQDTLAGKVAAWSDAKCRPSKRQKDLIDTMRLVELHPELRSRLPNEFARNLPE